MKFAKVRAKVKCGFFRSRKGVYGEYALEKYHLSSITKKEPFFGGTVGY